MDIVFVLGAPDPEMNAIEVALRTLPDVTVHHAVTAAGTRVTPREAYGTDNSIPDVALDAFVVTVECSVQGLRVDHKVDHHNPGDAGYGRSPDEFWEASSIGQVYLLIEKHFGSDAAEAAFDQKVINGDKLYYAASDHCPSHALVGMCPGIDREALRVHRARISAAFRGTTPEAVLAENAAAALLVEQLPVSECGRYKVAPMPVDGVQGPHWGNAAMEAGWAIQYYLKDGKTGQLKVGILNGVDSQTVADWMEAHRNSDKHEGVYGDPSRGYAGCYVIANE